MADRSQIPAMVRPNWRRMRADAFIARVYLAIDPLIADQDERHAVYDKLRELFIEDGVEIVTDRARAEAGLPPRDDHGMSPQELLALEHARHEVLMRPLMMIENPDKAPYFNPVHTKMQKSPAPE